MPKQDDKLTLDAIVEESLPNAMFKVELGNLMLMGCAVWMTLGILVMKKMVSFKF